MDNIWRMTYFLAVDFSSAKHDCEANDQSYHQCSFENQALVMKCFENLIRFNIELYQKKGGENPAQNNVFVFNCFIIAILYLDVRVGE